MQLTSQVCEDEMPVDLASNQVKVSMREERKKESIEQPFSKMKQTIRET
jgi:hypothetical protein